MLTLDLGPRSEEVCRYGLLAVTNWRLPVQRPCSDPARRRGRAPAGFCSSGQRPAVRAPGPAYGGSVPGTVTGQPLRPGAAAGSIIMMMCPTTGVLTFSHGANSSGGRSLRPRVSQSTPGQTGSPGNGRALEPAAQLARVAGHAHRCLRR